MSNGKSNAFLIVTSFERHDAGSAHRRPSVEHGPCHPCVWQDGTEGGNTGVFRQKASDQA
jgi:hypothetical protein